MRNCKNEDWFNELNKQGYFGADKVPFLVTHEDGSVSFPYWSQLDYLVHISEGIGKENDSELSGMLLLIIKKITEHVNDDGESFDNYFIWFKFISIIINIPNKFVHTFINKHNIDFDDWLNVWLGSKYENSVVTSDIVNKLLPKFILDSPNEADVIIGEKIVDKLLGVRFEEINYHEERKSVKKSKAKIICDDYWVVEGLINKHAALEMGKYCSDDFLISIIDRVKEILQFEYFDEYIEVEHEDKLYKIILTRDSKASHITQGTFHVDIREVENISDKKKASAHKFLNRDEVLNAGSSIRDFPVKLNAVYNKEQFVKKISKFFPLEDFEEGQKLKIEKLYIDINYDYTYISFKSIKNGVQHYSKDALAILMVSLRDLIYSKASNGNVSSFIDKMLTDEYSFPFFKRLVLYIVSEFYADYGKYAEQIIKEKPDIFCGVAYETEIFNLLQKKL